MTEDAAGRWPLLLPLDNADAAVAASRVYQAALMFEVVVACPACGVQQTFRGTVPEIGGAAEVWKQGHRCAPRLGGGGSAAVTNGKDVRLPGLG